MTPWFDFLLEFHHFSPFSSILGKSHPISTILCILKLSLVFKLNQTKIKPEIPKKSLQRQGFFCVVGYQPGSKFDARSHCHCYAPGLILCATHLSVLIFCYIRLASAYVYHRTALPLIPDIPAISILSCFRFTDASWLTCLFGPHFSRSCCLFDSYLPPLFLARVSHFYSYDFDLFCSLLSTILRISQPIPGFLTRLLGLL